jgi:hypothetical protein
MLKNLTIDEYSYIIKNNDLPYCSKNRIKAKMLNGIKTEAILVFARTALERYFIHIQEKKYTQTLASDEDTKYVYEVLMTLKNNLQKHVVNVDYLIDVVQGAKINSDLKKLAKYEEPLINYYDVMARQVSNHFIKKPAYIPEFLVICVLSHWIIEEENSIDLYPFLAEIDFTLLISKFELNRKEFEKDNKCIISDIFSVSSSIVEKLIRYKYKINKERISKTRKKK